MRHFPGDALPAAEAAHLTAMFHRPKRKKGLTSAQLLGGYKGRGTDGKLQPNGRAWAADEHIEGKLGFDARNGIGLRRETDSEAVPKKIELTKISKELTTETN
jgi:hypothetical protein